MDANDGSGGYRASGLLGRQTECLGEVEGTPTVLRPWFPERQFSCFLSPTGSADEGDNPVLAGVLLEFNFYDWSDDLLGT